MILKVEYKTKWYEFILTDGVNASNIFFDELHPYADELKTIPYVDHVPNPAVVERMCEAKGWEIDELSHELMIGRWELEVRDNLRIK